MNLPFYGLPLVNNCNPQLPTTHMGNATSADEHRLRDALRSGRCSEIYKQTIMPALPGSYNKNTLAKAFSWAF
jgi:hypothetical protein